MLQNLFCLTNRVLDGKGHLLVDKGNPSCDFGGMKKEVGLRGGFVERWLCPWRKPEAVQGVVSALAELLRKPGLDFIPTGSSQTI